jgi:hypothetical protein
MDYAKNVGTTRGIKREQSLLLKARWEFFSGFLTRSRVESASRTLASRRDTLNFAARRVEEDVRVAWDRLATAQRRLDILETAVELAEEVFDAKKRLRKAGKVTAPEVLNAENEVFGARIKLINADFDARIAAYLILRQIGMLTPASLQLSDSVASIPQNVSTQPDALAVLQNSPPKPVMPAAQNSKQPAVAVLSPPPQSAAPEPLAAALVPAQPRAKAPRLTQAQKVRGAKNSVMLRSPSFGGADGANSRGNMTAMSESERPGKTGKLLATARPAGPGERNAANPAPRKQMQPLPATPVAVALPPNS